VPTLYECVGGPLHGQLVAVPNAKLDLTGYVVRPVTGSDGANRTMRTRRKLVWLEDLHPDEPPGRDV